MHCNRRYAGRGAAGSSFIKLSSIRYSSLILGENTNNNDWKGSNFNPTDVSVLLLFTKEFGLRQEEFKRAQNAQKIYLNLEHLGETAEIFVNGANAGCLFMHPYQVEIPLGLLRQGKNTIEIRVRNLLINCAIDPSYPKENLNQTVSRFPLTLSFSQASFYFLLFTSKTREIFPHRAVIR